MAYVGGLHLRTIKLHQRHRKKEAKGLSPHSSAACASEPCKASRATLPLRQHLAQLATRKPHYWACTIAPELTTCQPLPDTSAVR
eukprot:1158953-Pelagomonas_calceolata.AAC.1